MVKKDRATLINLPQDDLKFTALIIYGLSTLYPTQKRKFSFFCHYSFKKSYPHYSTFPCSHKPLHKNRKAKSYNLPSLIAQKKVLTILGFLTSFLHTFDVV